MVIDTLFGLNRWILPCFKRKGIQFFEKKIIDSEFIKHVAINLKHKKYFLSFLWCLPSLLIKKSEKDLKVLTNFEKPDWKFIRLIKCLASPTEKKLLITLLYDGIVCWGLGELFFDWHQISKTFNSKLAVQSQLCY